MTVTVHTVRLARRGTPNGTAAHGADSRSVGIEVVATLQPIDIATDRCKGCGLCVEACPKHVLALDESVVNALGYHPAQLVDEAGCTSCAICARICPDTAFTIYAPARKARP
jgi:2-oxoglutarate ferredoxin oxidoreductase subunit delta